MAYSTYAEREYFGEVPREPREPTRYESDTLEARRLAVRGEAAKARTILRELIEHHYSIESWDGEAYDNYLSRCVPPKPADEAVKARAKYVQDHAEWQRFRDELFAMYVDPTARPSYEICQYGGE